MDAYHSLAPLNAFLNGCATVLLLAGFIFIKNGWVRAHRACMLSAVGFSAVFLTSYLIYHYNVGNVRFSGQGWVRSLYFSILIPHVILAGVIVPLAITTICVRAQAATSYAIAESRDGPGRYGCTCR